MNAPILAAVALGHKIESFGSYLGFAAMVGLGVLSLLYFAQAREVKRLREWAGRSPERDAELALRVQTDAQRRVVATPVATPRAPGQPASPQTAAAQYSDAARKAAAAGQAPGSGSLLGPPGQLDRPAIPAGAPPPGAAAAAAGAAAAAASSAPAQAGAAGSGGVPGPGSAPAPSDAAAPGSVPGAASGPVAAGASAPAAGPPLPPAATAAAAAAAARQAGPPSRTPSFANGAGGQDTHESDAARPAPLPDLPPRPPRTVTPAASRLSDDDGRHGGPRVGLVVGAAAATIAVGVLIVVLLTSGGDAPPADNEIGSTPPPAAAAPPPSASSTKVDRKATQVAVLNGTTQTGLARNVGNKLEGSGFTILSVGDNADQQIATTSISYSAGNEQAARVVAQIMDVPASAVRPIDLNTATAVDPSAKVVVVVGSDRSNTG